jgi:hypothetical protein
MTSHLARAIRSQVLLLSAGLALTWLGAGCEDKHIGRPCDLGGSVDAGPNVLVSFPGALECPSRICLLPRRERNIEPPTGPLCTAQCESNDDCDGERRGKNADDTRCRDGFICRRLLPGLSNDPLACKRLCVCKDFIITTPGVPAPDFSDSCNGDTPIN